MYLDDTGLGEAHLDRVLREALFDGGLDFPFSQPDSPSGRADVVSLDDSEDPLVLEVKVFDPDRGKGRSHLRQGFHQVLRYAQRLPAERRISCRVQLLRQSVGVAV